MPTASPDQISPEMIVAAEKAIRPRLHHQPTIGVILGSGLGGLAERVAQADMVPYSELPYFARSTVPGHMGRFVVGRLGGAAVMAMQGRAHYYEGYSLAQTTLPIRLMCRLGIQTLIVTNAAGGIRPGFRPGDLMVIADHINMPGLAGHNPLRGPNDATFGPRFPDMADAYDAALRAMAHVEADAQGLALHEGVYAMVAGPSFETPAEIRFLRAVGADAVGMSTAPEVVVARHAGMRVLGISLISNVAIDTPLPAEGAGTTHEEVLATGAERAPVLLALVEGIIRRLISAQPPPC
jgi:purine-nucleoside phosphorylase